MVVNTILGYLGSQIDSYFCKKKKKTEKSNLQNKKVLSLFFNFKMRYHNINLLHFIFLLHQQISTFICTAIPSS